MLTYYYYYYYYYLSVKVYYDCLAINYTLGFIEEVRRFFQGLWLSKQHTHAHKINKFLHCWSGIRNVGVIFVAV
jgi:hypothetical protein